MDDKRVHTPVLLQECIEQLAPQEGDTVLDATVGAGGHAQELCRRVGKAGMLVGIDADRSALEHAQETLADCPSRVVLAQANFRSLADVLASEGIEQVNRVIFDLGLSSMQVDSSRRGFSFKGDEPLDMRFDASSSDTPGVTASDIINTWPEETLSEIISVFGEEQHARAIARAIVRRRTEEPIIRTQALVEVIRSAVPARYTHRRIHPATKTFQALRMATNEEINALEEGLEHAYTSLAPSGRMAVISFHSIEDRIVKQFFIHKVKKDNAVRITKKPIIPNEDEVANNPRSRSAKLRVIQK